MRLQDRPPLHLTYCLNIHRGESWAENFAAIRDLATAVHRTIAPDTTFGLGLRLSATAAGELAQPRRLGDFRAFLAEQGLYVFTVNGFPYDTFHGGRVKERVYQPDWRTPERRDYTLQLASIMAELVPEDGYGSISTVPVSFKGWLHGEPDIERAIQKLVDVVEALERLQRRRHRHLQLGLEPEPACTLETTSECIAFLERAWHLGAPVLARRLGTTAGMAEEIMRRRLGVCFDTCHVALQFENLSAAWDRYQAAGVHISKVQLSAALACPVTPEGRAALSDFAEPTYLHQTMIRADDGTLQRWTDLPEALAAWPVAATAEARCHFHVPLDWAGGDVLRSTRDAIDDDFVSRLRAGACGHLEIETYTFDVLPPALRTRSVVESVACEYAWVLERLARR